MKTIETTITVLPDGSIKIPTHTELPPGEHRAVLVVDSRSVERAPAPPLRLKMLEIPGWPADARFRREELYDDERR
ncbi:MAG TPA: hypothetical protein VGJ87_20900 [Roseiflexaceae bacterium]|jgi:hypothetical protein